MLGNKKQGFSLSISFCTIFLCICYSYRCFSSFAATVKRPLSKIQQIGFQDQLSLNAGQKYCRKGSILQYFPPSISYHLSLRPLFCLYLSGRVTQVLLYLQHLSSANNLCKQFGRTSARRNVWIELDPTCLTLNVLLKEFFEDNFENNLQQTKIIMKNFPDHKKTK